MTSHEFTSSLDQDPLRLGPELAYETTELHENQMTVDGVLVNANAAKEKWHIDGDIMAIIELPATIYEANAERSPEDMRIAIVDYGKDWQTKKYLDIAPGLGGPLTRYQLRAINYTSQDHFMTSTGLPEDWDVEIGRGSSLGHDLGLDELSYDLSAISRKHLTFKLHSNGKVDIRDHSANGTKVYHASETGDDPTEKRVFDNDTVRNNGRMLIDVSDIPPSTVMSKSVDKSESSIESEVAKIENRLKEIEEKLGEVDIKHLQGYALAQLRKEDAQKRGDGSESTRAGQDAGHHYTRMSHEADIRYRQRYLGLMRALQKLYDARDQKAA
jgi:hypothetical protein